MSLRKLLFGERKKAKTIWTDVLAILNLINVDIVKLKAEVDMIQAKLRIPGLKKKAQELSQEQENSPGEKNELPNDGFDGIRRLRKDLNMNVS